MGGGEQGRTPGRKQQRFSPRALRDITSIIMP